MPKERMRQARYPREPKCDYLIFRFDDEISIGQFDIASLIASHIKNGHTEGAPIYPTGEELLKYKL